MNKLATHLIRQTLFPDQDKPQWMAFLILNKKYPKLTYLSMDGYHCHGIADYSEGKMFYWQNCYKGGILNWADKTLIMSLTKNFCDMTTEEIVNIWMDLCGETEESKLSWLNNMKERT